MLQGDMVYYESGFFPSLRRCWSRTGKRRDEQTKVVRDHAFNSTEYTWNAKCRSLWKREEEKMLSFSTKLRESRTTINFSYISGRSNFSRKRVVKNEVKIGYHYEVVGKRVAVNKLMKCVLWDANKNTWWGKVYSNTSLIMRQPAPEFVWSLLS